MQILDNVFFVIWIAIGAVLIYFQNRLFKQIKENYPEKWKSLGKPSVSRMLEAAGAPPWEQFDLLKEMLRYSFTSGAKFKGDITLDTDAKILRLKRLNQGVLLFEGIGSGTTAARAVN
jgi:hypothetical protein